MTIRIAILLTILINSTQAILAQDTPVLPGGLKIVTLENGDKLGKHIKGGEKKDIRRLVIKDYPSNSYGSSDFCEDFYKVLSQLPNLETVDVSNSKGGSSKAIFNMDNKIKSLNVKNIIIDNVYTTGDSLNIATIGELISRYDNLIGKMGTQDGWMNYIDYPDIEEFKILNVGWKQNDITQDSLYFNLNYNGLTPILVTKENALLLRKSNITNRPYHVIMGLYNILDRDRRTIQQRGIIPDKKKLNGAIICDNSILDQLKVDTLIIPSTIQQIINTPYKIDGEANVVIFEEGHTPLYIEKNALEGINIRKCVVVNRPATVLYRFHDLDSLIFNKWVSLPQLSTEYANLTNIKKLIFNDYTNIDARSGGSGHSMVLFRKEATLKEDAFGEIGTVRFEQTPVLERNYAKPDTVYVPNGFKSKIPCTLNNPTVYEIGLKGNESLSLKSLHQNSLPFKISPYKSTEIEPLNISALPLSENSKCFVSLCQGDFWKYIGKGEISELDKAKYKKTPTYPEQYKTYQDALNGLFYEVIPCKAYNFNTTGATIYQSNKDQILGSFPLLHIPQNKVTELGAAGRRDCALPLKETYLIKPRSNETYYRVSLPIISGDLEYLSHIQDINDSDRLGLLCIMKPGVQVNSDFGSYNYIPTPVALYLIDQATNTILADFTKCLDTSNPSKYKNIYKQREATINVEKKKQTEAAVKEYKKKYGENASPCATCAGTGRRTYTSSTTGQQYNKVCNVCGGSGKIYKR